MSVFKVLVLVFVVFVFSCENNESNFEKKYFDLKGYVLAQIKLLKSVEVKKTWKIDSAIETKKLKKLNWEKEFGLFTQSDINKKAYLQSYLEIKNIKSIEYNLKNNEELPIKQMVIWFNENREVQKIKIVKEAKNYLYHSILVLSLFSKNGKIYSYSIENNQKVFFGKMKHSVVTGEIL